LRDLQLTQELSDLNEEKMKWQNLLKRQRAPQETQLTPEGYRYRMHQQDEKIAAMSERLAEV
jgi:hypothetical protein